MRSHLISGRVVCALVLTCLQSCHAAIRLPAQCTTAIWQDTFSYLCSTGRSSTEIGPEQVAGCQSVVVSCTSPTSGVNCYVFPDTKAAQEWYPTPGFPPARSLGFSRNGEPFEIDAQLVTESAYLTTYTGRGDDSVNVTLTFLGSVALCGLPYCRSMWLFGLSSPTDTELSLPQDAKLLQRL